MFLLHYDPGQLDAYCNVSVALRPRETGHVATYALPFERIDDPIEKTLFLQRNWQHTITISVVYFVMMKLIERLMKHRSPFHLRWLLVIWNTSLALFSITGFVRFSEVSYIFMAE
ncbi:unnamed protein product [Toxocara canis]|uniref:Elongation of very long chain fatty acids protein n=1 Tax=Toxocara canis TaxID=6265 RepID=A0A183U9X4_TOXCA|nr:unnamed protein product [Toxocara canis]